MCVCPPQTLVVKVGGVICSVVGGLAVGKVNIQTNFSQCNIQYTDVLCLLTCHFTINLDNFNLKVVWTGFVHNSF